MQHAIYYPVGNKLSKMRMSNSQHTIALQNNNMFGLSKANICKLQGWVDYKMFVVRNNYSYFKNM
jgi:hypothetical protein